MIMFLNFAPIHYMGGAERKIYELFENTDKKEKSFILTVHEDLANIYGNSVLNQTFDDRSDGVLKLNKTNSLQLSFKHFVPFTTGWNTVRKHMRSARVIYTKSEVLEFIILFYFGGTSVMKKVIAGVRSPWVYPTPLMLIDIIHNFIYKSSLMKYIMQQTKFVHVLNTRDKEFFEKVFELKNVVYVPNYIDVPNIKKADAMNRKLDELRLIFIGELMQRKGIETLIKIIKSSPKNYHFDIIGDGPMKEDILNLASEYQNVTYHGYLSKQHVLILLDRNDALLFPSYAEGFGNVIIEAISVGLKVVDSTNIALNLPQYIEYPSKTEDYKDYIKNFKTIHKDKKAGLHDRAKIRKYCYDNYKTAKIMPQLLTKLFNLKP